MAGYTENLSLILPKKNENYDVEIANTNNKLIDTAIRNKVEKKPGKDLSTNDFTNEYKEKIDSMQTLYRFKGSVNTLAELQLKENNVLGDVWNCKADNKNYCWNKEKWVDIGLVIDVSGLATEQDINNIITTQNNIEEEIDMNKMHKYTMTITQDTAKRSRANIAVLL